MTDLVLPGLTTTPLGRYLGALGMLRAVSRLLDDDARGYWNRQRFVLRSRFDTVPDLVDELHRNYRPEPIVSPWNAGSGFAANGKSSTAEGLLDWVRSTTHPRLDTLREAVAAGDRVVGIARRKLGDVDPWGGGDAKLTMLALCRRELPDAVLPWVDAAVALRDDERGPAYARLLGTGANFGRQDLSTTYLAALRELLSNNRSGDWLRALCTGDESVPYLRGTVGQFDPGRSGGIQSSPLEDGNGFDNPWSFLFAVEGTLLFATAVVRRHGAQRHDAALPFQVSGSTAGHATAAAGEDTLGELWAPEWSAPARLTEIEHLFNEGRAQWRGRAARSGLDFVRAIASLGVDRGVAAYQRFVFVNRLGLSPLAVPAGRTVVRERAAVRLLTQLDAWRERLWRGSPPSTVRTRLRALEQRIFEHAREGDAAALVEVFAALGTCHDAVARSGAMRSAVTPLAQSAGRNLLAELWPATHTNRELRIALALATAYDHGPHASLRTMFSPVALDQHARATWTDRAPVSLTAGTLHAVAEAARRRTFPGAVLDRCTAEGETQPAVRGSRIAFDRGLRLAMADVHAFAAGEVDDHRLRAMLAGLLCVDWRGAGGSVLPCHEGRAPDPVLDTLSLFASAESLSITDSYGESNTIVLRPGHDWPSLLLAGRAQELLDDATRRLRISGLGRIPSVRYAGHIPEGLAIALLLPALGTDIPRMISRLSVIPQHDVHLIHPARTDQPHKEIA